jgi:hypothetical protein
LEDVASTVLLQDPYRHQIADYIVEQGITAEVQLPCEVMAHPLMVGIAVEEKQK